MVNDEREEEHQFLQGLKARTGRDLAEWMAAIATQGFSDKNEIIDWLRSEGLPLPAPRGWSAFTATAASRSTRMRLSLQPLLSWR
jgi:hypothetical protein